MKNEYTAEDFAKGVKNPYFNKLNKKTEVVVRIEVYEIFSEIAKENGVTPEIIMSRCLADYANRLKEAD